MLNLLLSLAPHALPICIGPDLAFRPPVGVEVHRSVAHELRMHGSGLRVWMGGEEVPSAYLPTVEFDALETSDLRLVDRFDPTAPRLLRVLELADHASSTTVEKGGSEFESGGPRESPLEGRALLWTWDGDRHGAGSASVECVDPESLEPVPGLEPPVGLAEDLDLRGLLPTAGLERLAPGVVWSAPASGLEALLHPMGNLDFERFEDEPQSTFRQRTWEGDLECRIQSIEDGLLVFALEGTVQSRTHYAGDLSMTPVAEGSATDVEDLELDVAGSAQWDLERSQLRQLDLDASFEGTLTTTKDEGQPGPAYRSQLSLSGEIELALKVERD